ncbi:MAG: hypothetical protein IKR27_01455, partial [Lachnospiraceae bacterium]|nr:hypothetical protein [Lachnospiraceae bacterium]
MPWNNKNIKPVEKKSLPYETFKEIYSLMGFEEWQYTKLYNKATEEELNNLSMFVATQREYGYDPLQFWGHPVSRNDRYDEDLGRMIYSNNKSTIPTWMQNCGDLDAVNKFMEENDSKLNLADTAFMMKKADAIRKANEKKKIDVRGERPKVTGGKNHAKIELNQERRQSSFNGCWSCSMQLMLKSRGVTNIEQEDIRAYRPPLSKKEEIEKAYGVDDNEHYNIDQGNEMFSMADAIVAYAPNTMVHETELETYNNDASSIGISRQEYNRNLAKAVKDNIIHAIHVDKSPVGVWHNGHYITVTEIKGDYLFYKDSNSNTPNKDEVISVSKLIKDMEDNEIKKPVKLVWVSDVILSKDGKTLYNVPSTYVQMNEDGSVKLPPEKIQQNGESYMHGRNQSGVTVARIGGIEDSLDERGHRSKVDTDGVLRTEKVYLPKQLNVTLLRKQAERRTDKEELDIAKNSKAFYRTEMPDFLKSKDDIDLRSTTLRLDAPAVKKSKAREDDIHDSKKLTGKGLEDFVNKDIERNEKRLDAEEKRIRKETEARNAAPKMAAFVRDLKTTPMFVMDYLDDEKANAIKNARIRIPKGKEIESINAMVLLYALGHKQWSIDNIVNLSDEQKVKLGDDFIEDMKKHSFIGSVQEIKDSVRYFGDITKKATEQLREENIELLPAKDQKRDVASFIGSNFANISKGWRSKKVYKLKNTEDLVIGNDYAKAFGSKEEYSDAMDYLDSFGGNKRKKNIINDNENRINDNEDNKRREEEEKKRQEDERKLRDENERKQREENQKKANDAKYNELRTLLFDPNLDAEGYKKFKAEFDKMPEDYKNRLKEENRQRKEAEKQRIDEEKRQKRLSENQKKLDTEMKSIFGMSREEVKKREQEIKRQKAEQERREKLLAEQKEQERLKKLEEEKEKQRKELEKVDVRTRFRAHFASMYDFIEKKFDTKRAELENSGIKDDDHFSEKYMELSKKELEAKRLSTNFRLVLKKIIPQEVFIETINRSFTDADKELIINECKGRKQILRGKTPNKTNKNEKSDYKVDAEEYIDSANVQIITRKSVLDSFIDALPDEYVAKIDEEMQKLPVLTNLSNEESVDHTHTARLNELKVFTLDHAKGDQKEKERLDKMLDRADKCLTKVKENVHSKYLEEFPAIYWNHYTRLIDRNRKRNEAGYENGQFANYQFNAFKGEPLNEEQLAFGEKIEQLNVPKLTPKYEQGLLAMLKKMDEMYDLSPEEIDAFSFEEQWKAYGNRQLIKSKTELEKAVDEGNIDKIEENLLIHEKDLENMREMHRMAKEVFADSEPYSAPGNIDSLRNTHVPLEFVRDNVTDSRVNGVFHLWLASKKCGVSPEEFIKNPAKYVKDASKKKLDDMRVEKKLAEDPVYILNYAGRYGAQFAGMAMFGLPTCVDRGISILASGEPDPVSRSNLYNYIKLGHDHYKIGFDKEYQKCMRLENVFHEEPMEHRDIFVSITGGCILGAGEEYDWNYGAPRIDDFGRTVTEKPKSFMVCYKANPVGLYEINSKIGNYIFSFQNSLRPDSPQRFKECNDCFIYGLFENTQTLLRELGPEEPGYHELEITMKYMSNYVINPELKQEMKDKVKQFDTVLEEKHRQL